MVIAVSLFTIVTILWIYILWSRRKYYAFALKMPGPIGLPILGIALKLMKVEELLYLLPKLASQYNAKTYVSWIGPYPMLYTMEPKVAQIILNSPDCINKSVFYDAFSDVIGDGLLTSKSPKWNKHRKLLNPAFSYKVLLDLFPLFNKLSLELCEDIDKEVNCGEVNIKHFLQNLTIKSSIASTMGLDHKQGSDEELLLCYESLMNVALNRAVKPWLKSNTIFSLTKDYKPFIKGSKIAMDYTYNLVMDKIKIYEQQGLKDNNKSDSLEESVDVEKNKHIFIDQAIKIHQKNEFTFDDIIQEANIIVFAAAETTASTLFSTLMCLAMHPQYQDKVFEEIVRVFPQKEFDVNHDDFKNLVYLDMCINETLRVTATIPLVARACTRDVPISKDIVIPKGTQIVLDIFNMHRDEDIWGSYAKTFYPDHFLPANLSEKHKYSFMPFLRGPRNCIGWQYAGMVLKIALVQVLRKYRFSTKFCFEDLRFVENITLKYRKLPLLEIQRR